LLLHKIVELIKKRDRIVLLVALFASVAFAWVYLLHLDSSMPAMDPSNSMAMETNDNTRVEVDHAGMSMPMGTLWGSRNILLTILMWAVMMVAMMVPSATPMVLTYDGLNRRRYGDQTRHLATVVFLFGYLIVWIAFSVGITFFQLGFQAIALVNSETLSASPPLGGILLILAGVYQFTLLKDVCLSNCRTPLSFLLTEWREAKRGALIMGLRHGLYCLGCCWPLMLLLFVIGVMNLLWVLVIAGIVLVEKAMPEGRWVSRVIGMLTIVWGAWLLTHLAGI
jgi:predicted metal-binding membrane protein